jgi:hypothetical protein
MEGKQDLLINLENLAQGFYFIKLSVEEKQYELKFLH